MPARTLALGSVAYLGPPGTFCEGAARALADAATRLRPFAGATEILAAVAARQVQAGVVPLLNSRYGLIAETADALLEHEDLRVARIVQRRVSFDLYARAAGLDQLRAVASHRAALAQCAEFVAERGLETRPTASTAEALRLLADGALDRHCGVLAAPQARTPAGLRRLARGVEGGQALWTRFARVELGAQRPAAPGAPLLVLVHAAAPALAAFVRDLRSFAPPTAVWTADERCALLEWDLAAGALTERLAAFARVPGAPRWRLLPGLVVEGA